MQFVNRISQQLVRKHTIARSYSKTVVVQAEGVTGRIADDSEQATGLRKDELEAELKGQERFNRSMLWVDKVGTYTYIDIHIYINLSLPIRIP